jgi:C4-dicarboxylate-specific signal transduction histidine kinase
MTDPTPLGRLLDEYAVPLKVWLAPGARVAAADILIDTLGTLAEVQTDPLSYASQLEGPAVMVLTADDLRRPNREALLDLATRARPGRVVLIGGTADRDILMEAINTWRAFRVISANAPKAELVDVVREAGEALRREVALGTAIDDLDLETTMLDSAIGQMRSGQARALRSERQSAVSSVAAGLAKTFAQEQAALEGLAEAADTTGIGATLRDALDGVRSITQLFEQLHDHALGRQSGVPASPESVDDIVTLAAELAGLGPGTPVEVDAQSNAASTVDPYALTHLLVRLIRVARSAAPENARLSIRCTAMDQTIGITIPDPGGGITEDHWSSDAADHLTTSAAAITTAGGHIESHNETDGTTVIQIRFPMSPQDP